MPALATLFWPDRASTLAPEVDNLFLFAFGIALFFTFLIFLLIAYFAIRYRKRTPNDPAPPEIHGSTPLEVAWTVVPLVIVTILFVVGTRLYFAQASPPANATTIYVVGKQWMWKIQHPEGKSEINELHVPIGQPVRLLMTSEDVIHDFFVPAFRIKKDVVPGRYSSMWFTPTRVGTYHLFCSQYCGTLHASMIGWVTVMEPADFQQWLSGNPAGETMVQAGERLFGRLNCASCHREGGKGPPLSGVFGKPVRLADGSAVMADDAYLRESILNPQAKVVAGYVPQMPVFQGQVSETDVLDLIAYIKSLGGEKESSPK